MEKGENLNRRNLPTLQQLRYLTELEKEDNTRGMIARIAEKCQVSTAPVSRYLKSCCEKGLLTEDYRFTKKGQAWIENYKRIREIENQKDYQDLQDELIDRFGEYPDQVAYLIEIGLVKAYLDAAFAELVERKNDTIIVRFEKVSLKFFLTQDYFEAISKTNLKARISDNQGKVEIIFDVRNKKDYEILEELKIFGQTFMEIKKRKEKKET